MRTASRSTAWRCGTATGRAWAGTTRHARSRPSSSARQSRESKCKKSWLSLTLEKKITSLMVPLSLRYVSGSQSTFPFFTLSTTLVPFPDIRNSPRVMKNYLVRPELIHHQGAVNWSARLNDFECRNESPFVAECLFHCITIYMSLITNAHRKCNDINTPRNKMTRTTTLKITTWSFWVAFF